MKKVIFALAAAAAATSMPAIAQDAGGNGGRFAQRDQTRAEAQQRADTMFQMLDANKDATVTKAEADAALAQFQSAQGDAGGHGAGRMQRMLDQAFATIPSLTLKQFETQLLARFDAMDLDHNGTVTAAERQQLREQRQAARGQVPAAAATPAPAAPAKPQ
jgi:Ca2+-binding EF-hand superfamily protein